jgi:hypothetical protein
VLLVPVYEVFIPYENKPEKKCWELRFIWEDSIILLSYMFLLLFWILNIVKQNGFLKIFLIAFSTLNLIGAFLSLSMPSQDLTFQPGIGIFMILCFLILFYLIKLKNVNRNTTSAKSGYQL